MSVADFMARLDHIEDGVALAPEWASGCARLDGWQLEYAGRVYGVSRVPGRTLTKCVAWSERDVVAFRAGTRAREKMTVFKFLNRLAECVEG